MSKGLIVSQKILDFLREKWYVKKGASVAQSVERGTENPCVGGSIPPGGTNFILAADTGGSIFY